MITLRWSGDHLNEGEDEDALQSPAFPVRRRMLPGSSVVAFAFTALVVVGTIASMMLGASRDDLSVDAAAAAAAAAFFLVSLSAVLFLLVRLVAGKGEGRHRVAILDVLPGESQEAEPFFVASCDCGWLGEPRDDLERARDDSFDHSPYEDPEVVPTEV